MSKALNITIAWAKNGDEAALLPLISALYHHEQPDVPAPRAETAAAHITKLLAPLTPHRLALAWASEGRAIGLASVGLFVSVSDPRPEEWHQAELKELFVLPQYQSMGVGAALLDWVERHAVAKGACRLDWHVKDDNAGGLAFYGRRGGAVVANRLSMRKGLIGN